MISIIPFTKAMVSIVPKVYAREFVIYGLTTSVFKIGKLLLMLLPIKMYVLYINGDSLNTYLSIWMFMLLLVIAAKSLQISVRTNILSNEDIRDKMGVLLNREKPKGEDKKYIRDVSNLIKVFLGFFLYIISSFLMTTLLIILNGFEIISVLLILMITIYLSRGLIKKEYEDILTALMFLFSMALYAIFTVNAEYIVDYAVLSCFMIRLFIIDWTKLISTCFMIKEKT